MTVLYPYPIEERMSLRSLLHKIVLLRPLLKILGVKGGTVADKAAEAAQVVDQVLPQESDVKK